MEALEAHDVGLFEPGTHDTIDGMPALNRRCGILAGPTGGAAYFGTVRQLRAVDDGSVSIVDEVFERLLCGGLPFSRNRPVLLACPVGEKFARYAAPLTRMGHPDVRSPAGGIIA